MIFFPNCKINLGLQILGKRSDGYHELETVFYPVKIFDAIECVQAHEFSFLSTGLDISGNEENNETSQKTETSYERKSAINCRAFALSTLGTKESLVPLGVRLLGFGVATMVRRSAPADPLPPFHIFSSLRHTPATDDGASHSRRAACRDNS